MAGDCTMIWSAYHIANFADQTQENGPHGWRPARPLNYQFDSWWDRIKWAWGVLRGRYDVLDWDAG